MHGRMHDRHWTRRGISGRCFLLQLCIDVTGKSLLDRRLVVEAARLAREIVGERRWMEVWYVALIDKPGTVAEGLLEWAGLHSNPVI